MYQGIIMLSYLQVFAATDVVGYLHDPYMD